MHCKQQLIVAFFWKQNVTLKKHIRNDLTLNVYWTILVLREDYARFNRSRMVVCIIAEYAQSKILLLRVVWPNNRFVAVRRFFTFSAFWIRIETTQKPEHKDLERCRISAEQQEVEADFCTKFSKMSPFRTFWVCFTCNTISSLISNCMMPIMVGWSL